MLRKNVIFISLGLFVYRLVLLGLYAVAYETEKSTGIASMDGSLNTLMLYIQTSFLLLLIIFFVCMRGGSVIRKLLSLSASILMVALYIWWYLEKYTFLLIVYGLREGSSEYKEWLSEIGVFRGSNSLEFLALIATGIITIYALFQFISVLKSYVRSREEVDFE